MSEIAIQSLDHLVLTVRDLQASLDFYTALGFEARQFRGGRWALHFGQQKINLHVWGQEFEPKAERPTPGSADLCFLLTTPLDAVIKHINAQGLNIVAGPIERTGATGPIRSIYLRDPDQNLIELSEALA